MKLKGKLKYILLLAALWALPLVWVVAVYLTSVPASCRPDMEAWWYCLAFGYILPPFAFAPIGIGVFLATIYLVGKIVEKKE